MDYHTRILEEIHNLSAEVLRAGADDRVEDRHIAECVKSGFTHADIWVIYSNIQATSWGNGGDIITQTYTFYFIRTLINSIISSNLSRRVNRQTPKKPE